MYAIYLKQNCAAVPVTVGMLWLRCTTLRKLLPQPVGNLSTCKGQSRYACINNTSQLAGASEVHNFITG